MVNGRLKWSITYLCGPIDCAADRGRGWRNDITPILRSMDIGILNPLDKSTIYSSLDEDEDYAAKRRNLIEEKRYDEVRDLMKKVIRADLAMVDKADFLIAYIDTSIHMCGSYHEIAVAAHQRKPTLIVCRGGKSAIPPWEWGIIPHEFFFSSFDGMLEYLEEVNRSSGDIKLWRFFDMEKIYGRKLF